MPPHDPASAPAPPRLRQPRLAELIAERVRSDLASGRRREGERLPRQEDLAAELGVSLTVVREALRILEAEGLVEVHRGKVGGASLRRPGAAAVTTALHPALGAAGVTDADVDATLAALDGLAAAKAAELRSRPARLALAERLRSAAGDASAPACRAFHHHVAASCGLGTLAVLIEALAASSARACEALAPAAARRAHEGVAAAIEQGDGGAAAIAASHRGAGKDRRGRRVVR